MRWKFLRTMVGKQNIYLALSGFFDAGMVTAKYNFDRDGVPKTGQDAELAAKLLITTRDESLHMGAGAGIHIVMNQNFVVAVDYGRALDKGDGESGLYIGLNFLY
jgi:hypothetical protein